MRYKRNTQKSNQRENLEDNRFSTIQIKESVYTYIITALFSKQITKYLPFNKITKLLNKKKINI